MADGIWCRASRSTTSGATCRSRTCDRPQLRILSKVGAATGSSLLAIALCPASPAFADSVRDRQWYLESLQVARTRSISTGAGVTVAVLDTGVASHPDVKRNLLSGSDLTSSSIRDGRNDIDGHGTRMAALIAGHGRSPGSGIQGIAPNAKVLPVRISKDGHEIDSAVMAEGVIWSANQKSKIINISAGAGPGFDLQDAINSAINDDIVVVAAVGNTSSGAIVSYPAAFDGVLAVGASDRNGKYSAASVKDDKVQICAPGVDIISAQPTSTYGSATGTSDSSAIVSGAAALVRSKFPELSAKDVIRRLTDTADDIGPPGRDDECGFGRLNIVKALTVGAPPPESATTAPSSGDPNTATNAPGAVRPEFASPEAAATPEPASDSRVLIWGGLAGALAIIAVLAGLLLRRRRRS
ncbi:S8 family serine peptidase [Paractinoplanes hotanensis]|uniref:S8 family serine peptidase n=1 Tax=Paractinoplanes hotanensis TaxID=2906497 RepID=A0ABT0YD72_9ACTN|nr:S8 family serine peptidase [Actinoplanes hotanensis]MCM4084007.1 S8 family serine peptidase [Actinoplanes hotanensis]